jgi:hypothetical protein
MKNVVMHLECLKEFFVHFFLCLLSSLDVRVLACIVSAFDIFLIKYSITAEVNLLESLLHELCAELVHRADDDSDKLVKADLPGSVNIECLEETIDVLLINFDLEVLDALAELVKVK